MGGRFSLAPANYLIIMGWQLLQKLSNSVSFSDAVHVRHLILGYLGEIQMNLNGGERRRKENKKEIN